MVTGRKTSQRPKRPLPACIFWRVNCRGLPGIGSFAPHSRACFPLREAKLRPQSPFGISGIICNDRAYPDQPAMETVLALCTRIGVHWMRALQFPLRGSVDAQEVRSHRQQWEAFRRHGITAHVQCADPFVMDPHGRQRFERQFAASLPAFAFLSPCFEVGNELNLGDQLKAADYVERLLRPQYDVMRRITPNAKVATMGFGGVDATWWKGFVRAGGLKCCDVISIHPGHQPRAPEYSQWGGWEFLPQLRRVFNSLEKAGLTAKREVWISEAYAPSDPKRSYVDCRTAADYLVREYCVSLALGVRLLEVVCSSRTAFGLPRFRTPRIRNTVTAWSTRI